MKRTVNATDWLNQWSDDIYEQNGRLLVKTICLHFNLPQNKLNIGKVGRYLSRKNLIELLKTSPIKEVQNNAYSRWSGIHPAAFGSIKFSAMSEIINCPDSENTKSDRDNKILSVK